MYDAKEALQAGTGDTETLKSAVKAAEESLATAKKNFRETYLKKYSFVDGNGALGVGRQILAQGDRSMAVGDYAKAISSDAIAYGGQTLANGTNSMAMGGKAHVGTEETGFNNSMAIGSHTNVQAGNAVALGAFSQVTGTNSLALGFGTQSSTDSNSITYNSVSGHDSTLIGSYGNIAGNNSILIGSSGNIANDRVVGLGNNINIAEADPNDQENNTAGSVFLGDHAGYVKDSKRARTLGKVDVVGSAGKMELTESLSSTKGALRDYTKDFIYIYMLERQDDGTQIGAPIAVRSDFAGGDSTVGVVSVGSTYEQNFENLDKIKEHHKKVGSLITVPVEVTVQVTKNGISLGEQKQTRYFAADAKEEDIKNDSTLSDKDKEKVWNTIQESLKKTGTKYTVFETRRIQNVAPGLIGVNSTDAINGSQLFATNQMLGNLVGSLKKTFGDNVTITEDGQIKVSGGTLGWIAKAKAADGGTVDYQVGKDDKITKDNLKEKGSAIEAADQLVFQAGKNIGLVQTPDTLTISTIDTPSFKSVELRGDEKTVDGKKVTEVTKIDSSGMKVVTETSTPASDGSTTPTVTEKVSTTVGKDGVSTDGSVKVTNGKDGDQAKDLVTIGKGTDGSGTDKEYGKIGLDGKNGSNATITVDRGTKSLNDDVNIGVDPSQPVSKTNESATMDRITYTTTGPNNTVIDHEVATMDDGLFFSGDSADGKEYNGTTNTKNTFGRKLSEEAKIVGGVTAPANLTDNNIGVVSNGSDTLTIKLAKQLTGLDSATYTSPTTKADDGDATSTMKVDGNGIRFVGDNNAVKTDAPSLTTDGITGGNKTITNVASGIGGEVKDSSHNNANTFLENVNKIGKKDGDQPAADAISENVVVNAKDLKNLVDTGFKLNTSGQGNAGATTVRIGDTINIIDGANTKVSAIDDSTTGTYTFHIDVTGMPISYTDNQGNALTKIGDKYYKNTDIADGVPNKNAVAVDPENVTDNIKVINKDGSTTNPGTISNVKSAIEGTVGNGAHTTDTINGTQGNNTFIDNVNRIGADTNGIDKNSVVTTGDLKNLADTPLFFQGDVSSATGTNNTFSRKLSEKVSIVGEVKDGLEKEDATAEEKAEAIRAKLSDGNIGVVSNGTDTLTIKLAKNLVNLTSVETGSGNNKTKMTENGVTTTVKDGDTFKVTTTTPNGLATTEVKLDSEGMPKGESTTTMVTTDGVTITTQTPPDPDGDKPASTTETKLSKDGLATDGTIKVTGDNAKDLVTIGKGTDGSGTDKEYGKIGLDGKNGSNATLTVDRGTKSVTDKANILKDPKQPAGDNNPVSMDRLTYTTTGADGKSIINHEVATLDDGFFLTTEHTEADKTRTVLFNNTIKVLDGANTKVSAMGGEDGTHTFSIDVTGLPVSYTVQQDGNTTPENVSKVGDTYQLANGTKLVKVGDKFYKPDQLVDPTAKNPTVKQGEENKDWKLTNNVSLVNPNGGKDAPTLSNVGSALKKSGGTRITMSDLDDSSVYPTNNPIWNNAVNVGDLKAATDAARTEVTGTGEAFVTSKQATDGHTIYNVHVDKILSHKDAAGNELVRGGDGKYYTNEAIKDKTYIPSENKWYSNSDLTNGKPNKDAQAVTPNPVDQSNVKTSLVNPNTGVGTGTDTSMTLDNVKSGIGGDAKNGIKDGTTVDGTAGNNTFIKNLDKVGGTGEGAIDKTTVVNAGDLKNLADTPLFFSGDAADGKNGNVKNTFGRKLSEEAKIVGGVTTPANLTDNNIGVVSNGSDTLTIKLAKQLTGLDSATYTSPTTKTDDGDATSTMKVDGNGIRFVGDNNAVKTDAPSLTTDGITGGNKQITNVGSGLKDGNTTISISDLDDSEKWPNTNPIWNNAVNVGDLKKAKDAATTEVTGTGKAIVTKTVGNKGQNIYNVHVDPVVDVVATDGKTQVVRGDDGKYYNPTDIADKTFVSDGKGGGSWYNKSDIGANGKPNTGAPVQNISPVDVKNNFVNPNGTGSIVLDNVKSGIGGEVKDAAGKNTFIDNINKVGKKNPDAISENTVVNAKDLKNVVDTGFKLNTSGHNGDAQTVKIGDTIQVVDGKNTTVSAITHPTTGVHEFHIDVTGLPVTYTATEGKNGQPVDVSKVGDTYQLADGTKLVKYGDKFYKPNQIVNGQPVGDAQGFTINDDIRLVNPNNGTGPVKITNVAPGVGDNDAVNMSQLKNLSAGSKTEVTGTGAAEVTKKTAKDGHDIYNVHVDKLLTVKPVTPGTAMERGADGKYYAPSEIQDKTFVSDGNGGGSWYAKDDVDEYGTPLDGKSPLAQQPTALDPNTLKTSVTNPNGNGPTIVDNVKSVLDGSGIGNGADMSSKIDTIENGKPVDTAGSNQFIKDLTGLNPTTDADKLNSVSTVSDLQKVALTPLFFEGDTAESATTNNAFGRKLSEKAKIVGGQKDVTKLTDNNIGVVSNGSDTLTVKLAKELQGLTSLTTIDETDGTKTIVSGKGVTTDGKVVVNNGKTGNEAKEFVTIDKGTDGSGTDKEYGKIGLDGKNGSEAVITIDRGTKSLNDDVNIGVNPSQPVSETNESATMDRITYTTTGPNNTVINHEVATLDDGFFLTTSKDVTDNKAAAKVKLNNTIKFTDGANTKVSTVDSKDGIHELHVDVTGLPVTYTASELDDNGKPTNTQNVSKVGDTYQLEDGTKLVKVDDKYYTPDQLENGTPKPGVKGLTIDNSIRVINPEQPNSTAKITNVAPGEADTDAVNMSQLKQQVAAATTEVTGTGAAEVTKVTGANGQNIYNVHVDKLMTVKPVDANSTIARGGDGKYYNADDIADKTFVSDGHGGGSWYDANDVDQATGKPKTEDDGITPKQPLTDQPQAVDQNMLKNSVVNPNGDGATIVDNVKSGIGGKVKDTSGKNTFIDNINKVGKKNDDGTVAPDAISENTVVNAGDLKNLADTPLFFSGDAADGKNGNAKNTFGRKLSEEAKIVGGVTTPANLTDNNIGVVSNGSDTLTVKLAKELTNLTSVTTGSGDNKTVMNQAGVTITSKTNNPDGTNTNHSTSITKDGVATDGTVKVTNGKDGQDAKDLVTIGKGTETDPNATDKEFGTVAIDGKNGSKATLTVDRGTKSVTDSANVGKDPTKPIDKDNPVAGMDRLTYTTTGPNNTTINHEVATLDDGFMLTTSTDVANSKAPANVKLNNTIKFTDGANTKVSTVTSTDGVHELHIDVTGLPMTYTVSQTGGTDAPVSVSKVGDTYQLADGTKLVKVDNKFYKPSQLVNPNAEQLKVKPEEVAKDWTVNDSISLVNKDGSNNAPTLKNVGSGLKDANGNSTTLDKAVGSNAVNVDDLRTMGKAATTEVTGTGAAEVTKVTGADGQNIYNVHVDKLMTVKPVDSATKVARGGDGKYYNADDIKDKTFVPSENKWYDTADVDATTGKPLEGKSALAKQPIALDQSKLKNSVVNPNGDGATIVDNVKSGIGGEVKDTSGKNTFIKKLEKVGGTGEGAIDKTTVVNAGDLKNLADTPLFFQGDVSSATGTNNTFSRKLSEKVSIVGEVKDGLADTASAEDKANAIRAKLSDGNIGVVSNGTDTLTIKLAKDLTDLHSVTTTDDKGNTTQINGNGLATTADGKITTVTSDGITIVTTDKDGNSVSLTNKGLDNGHHQIINVKSGLLDRQGNPVTLKNASEDILNNAVNVRDLRDVVQGLTDSGKGGGFGLTGNNGEVHKSLGETITLKGGIANKIENGIDMNKPEKATTDKNTYIDVKTSKNGSEKIMVVEIAKDLTDLNSAEFTDQEGNTTKMKGDGIYIDKNGDGNADISLTSEGLNNGGNKITNVADGTEDTDAVNVSQLNKLKQEIKQNIGDEINELNAYAPVVYTDKNGNRVIRKGNKFVKKNDETVEILPQDIRLSLVNADGKTTNPSTLQNVAEGVQDTDAVNVKQLKEATEKPLTFNGDAGSSSAKLGETVAIKGGANSADLTDNNIGVIADSSTKTLNVKLSKKLKGLESAEFVDNNGNTTNITGDGVHISGGNGSNVSLTSQGLNNGGNRITNVAPGVEATDAVNVSQLNQVGAALHNRINNVAKGAYGGVASAGAMASLPQAYLPGKSMVAAGASHYRGESAVALGASRISDNGKIILKLNASHNTSGNTMVGAGVGYQF
ncbi:YadA-like family protein [Gallibacterium anatis]|uniref:YadA-like family protein n=1 Tax=Gallibacterium anatis TaxID=750 RepID=UPI001E3562A6|nr:YadA-like family protein [Gallibacterium anatis]